MDIYQTIVNPTTGDYRDRGSKFLAYAYPVFSEEEIRNYLEEVKKEHPKAGHHCYAYRLGVTGDDFRANDDGEPSGSAGRPILGQIDSFGLTNVLIIVVRYWGGSKLGIPGLINAYKQSTIDALSVAEIEERTIDKVYQLTFEYGIMSPIMGFLKKENIEILNQEFGDNAVLDIAIRESEVDQTLEALKAQLRPSWEDTEPEGLEIAFLKTKL